MARLTRRWFRSLFFFIPDRNFRKHFHLEDSLNGIISFCFKRVETNHPVFLRKKTCCSTNGFFWYCWWKKSYTTWDVSLNNGMNYLPWLVSWISSINSTSGCWFLEKSNSHSTNEPWTSGALKKNFQGLATEMALPFVGSKLVIFSRKIVRQVLGVLKALYI